MTLPIATSIAPHAATFAAPSADPVATPASPRPDAVLRRFRASLHDGRVHPLYVALRHLRAANLAVPGG